MASRPGLRARGESSGRNPDVIEASIVTNAATAYMRTRFVLDPPRLAVSTPTPLLVFIPRGRTTLSLPLRDVRSMNLGSAFHPLRLLTGALLAGAAIWFDLAVWLLVPAVLLTVALVLMSWIAVLRIESRTGPRLTIPVCVFQLPRANRLIDRIEQARTLAAGSREPRPERP